MRSTVRWDEDTQSFELRCESCARRHEESAYWPLTDEFWKRGNMTSCRACLREAERLRKRRVRD